MENRGANFEPLKDPRITANRSPPTYKQPEIDRPLAECFQYERVISGTLLLTGVREKELCFLIWDDVDVRDHDTAAICVSGKGKEGFSPEDYQERRIPIPQELVQSCGEFQCTCGHGLA